MAYCAERPPRHTPVMRQYLAMARVADPRAPRSAQYGWRLLRPTAAAAALACLLAGCAGGIDAGQARTCRSVIPALNPSEATFEIVRTGALRSGEGVRVDYLAR